MHAVLNKRVNAKVAVYPRPKANVCGVDGVSCTTVLQKRIYRIVVNASNFLVQHYKNGHPAKTQNVSTI